MKKIFSILPILILLILLPACTLREATPEYPVSTESAQSPEASVDPVQPIEVPEVEAVESETLPESETEAETVLESEISEETLPESEKSKETMKNLPETIPETEAVPEPETAEPETAEPETAIPAESVGRFSPAVLAQMEGMTDRELLMQMLLISSDSLAGLPSLMQEYGFGGVLFFANNFENETPESFRAGIDAVNAVSKIPALFAVDEEGGMVTRISRFPQYRGAAFWSPRALYTEGGLDLIRSDAREKANLLASLGLNYNLGPVADITDDPADFIYYRSPASDSETASEIVTAIIEEEKNLGIAASVKHFPGYGSAADTHTGMAYDSRPLDVLESFDLIPFRRAMDAEVASVMVSHIITSLDPERPATVSSTVVSYIRDTMAYDGVLLTDDMAMNGILDYCPTGNGALEAILAGYDLVCCSNWTTQLPALLDALEQGTLTRDRLTESVGRILEMKQDYGIWVP